MSVNVLNRKLHYWASAAAAVPLLIMIGSGLLLQSKKHWSWVQPVEQRGTGAVPAIDLESIHDGSFFAGDWTKLGLFLPAGLTLLFLWVSGLWMWWVPFIAKRRRARVSFTPRVGPSAQPSAAPID